MNRGNRGTEEQGEQEEQVIRGNRGEKHNMGKRDSKGNMGKRGQGNR